MCWNLDANDVIAARSARKAIAAALREFASTEQILGSAELVVGELLSNAARHAGGHVCLELGLEGGHAQISVHDTSAEFALDFNRLPDTFSESGRGLFIISELARKVSVTPREGIGKRVTVTLNLPVCTNDAFAPTCHRSWLRNGDGVCSHPRVSRYYRAASESERR